MRRVILVSFGVLLLSPFEARAVEFAYGFEGCPSEITGEPGESKVFDVFVTLTTSDNPSQSGAQYWNVSLTADGGTIEAITLNGVHVSTLLDHDGNPATPSVPRDLDLANAELSDAELAVHSQDPSRRGAISIVVISFSQRWELLPSGTQRIARVSVRAVVPSEVTLRFEDGFQAIDGDPPQPGRNAVTFEGSAHEPALNSCRIRLQSALVDCNGNGIDDATDLSSGTSQDCNQNGIPDECEIDVCDLFRRGDCDGDGQVRGVVTDAVFLLNFNFLGGTRPECFAACDANGDGQVSGVVTDAVYLLSFNFLGGPAPPEPFPGCGQGTPGDVALGCETPPGGCMPAG